MVLIVAGVALLGLTLVDLLSTTLSVASATGVVSIRLADQVWRGARRAGLSHHTLRHAGPWILVALVTGWVVSVWAGWALIFVGAGEAVTNATTGAPADIGERIYYAGYLVATLGNGDYVAAGTAWRIASVIASLTGLLTATMAITFLVPVVSGVVQRRQLATQIASLGDSPRTMLTRAWDGTDFSALTPHLSSLLSQLHLLAQRHLAYPVLHYFHADQRHTAIAPMVAVLDDVLLLLVHGTRTPGVDTLTLSAARTAVDDLLALLHDAFIAPASEPPDIPALACVRELGADTVDDQTFTKAVDHEASRRCLLRGFVDADGWTWDDVGNA